MLYFKFRILCNTINNFYKIFFLPRRKGGLFILTLLIKSLVPTIETFCNFKDNVPLTNHL